MILDVGCGHTEGHIPRGNVKIDVEKPLRKLENFVLADAQHLPFKPSCFETVSIIEVLYYVSNPMKAILEAHQVLKSDGKLVLGFQNPLHWRRILRSLRNEPIILNSQANPDMHIYTWTEPEIRNLLGLCGFRLAKIAYHIPESATRHDRRTHIRLDKLVHQVFRNVLSGRSFMVIARATPNHAC